MELISRGRFFYSCNGSQSFCYCHVLNDEDKTIAVFTEMTANKGTSVTNAAEELASIFCEDHKMRPDKVTFVERYQHSPDILDSVNFKSVTETERSIRFRDPVWRRMTAEEATPILALIKDK